MLKTKECYNKEYCLFLILLSIFILLIIFFWNIIDGIDEEVLTLVFFFSALIVLILDFAYLFYFHAYYSSFTWVIILLLLNLFVFGILLALSILNLMDEDHWFLTRNISGIIISSTGIFLISLFILRKYL